MQHSFLLAYLNFVKEENGIKGKDLSCWVTLNRKKGKILAVISLAFSVTFFLK
jgi:hypothetical protein